MPTGCCRGRRRACLVRYCVAAPGPPALAAVDRSRGRAHVCLGVLALGPAQAAAEAIVVELEESDRGAAVADSRGVASGLMGENPERLVDVTRCWSMA